ncbi:MAG: protein-glutamate O-methyltransferase CheR, partial [Dehalococcoidia bacterium]
LTINVSEFFRDPDQFARLRSQILPELLSARRRIRIWSAGCSHGAEPYSIAMLLSEPGSAPRVPILATDMDTAALAQATAGGPYSPDQVRNVPRVDLRRYFRSEEGQYWINDGLRRLVEFREHNVLDGSFGRDFDLIMCRNVMIYLSSEAKARLLRRLSGALIPGGVLFVGGTEAILESSRFGLQRLYGDFYQRVASVPHVSSCVAKAAL